MLEPMLQEMSKTKENQKWQDANHNKNVPSGDKSTMSAEVHQSATPLSGTPQAQENGMRPRLNKTRNYTKTTWSREEKLVIYQCYCYSRSELWSKDKETLFWQQLLQSPLPKEKLQGTTPKKLQAIASQVAKYLTPEEMAASKKKGEEKAEKDFQNMSESEKANIRKRNWTVKEKWTIIWSMTYTERKYKSYKSHKKRTEEWKKDIRPPLPR